MLDAAKKFLFVQDDDNDYKPVDKPSTIKPTAPKAVAPSVTISGDATFKTSPETSVTSVDATKFKASLATEFVNNFTDTAYAKFQKLNTGMKAKIGDTSARISTIGVSLDVSGITKDALLDDATRAVSFLTGEGSSFVSDIAERLASIESHVTNEVSQIEAAVQSKQDTIKSLQEEILDLEKTKNFTKIQANTDKTNLEMNKVAFTSVLTAMVQEVNNDISDITRYIGG